MIAANIRQLREKQSLTQEQLAYKVGVNRNVVTMWETGKNIPPTKYLLAIAETLDCTVDELLKNEST